MASATTLLVGAILAALLMGPAASDGATSDLAVSMSIPSATSLGATGCASGTMNVTSFGTVLPGTSHVTSGDCTLTWGSSNDTSMLRLYQQDSGGYAMTTTPPSNALGWWPLNASGSNIGTAPGSLALGPGANAPGYVAGQAAFGQALSFDGNDYATVPANAAYDLTTFTVDLWFKTSNTGIQVLVDKTAGSSCGSNCNFELYMNSGNVKGSVSAGGVNSVVSAAPLVSSDGNWHHVALVLDGTTRRLSIIVDGIERANTTLATAVDTPAADLTIGSAQNFSTGFVGQLDEVRVQNVARTEAELRGSFGAAVADFAPGADWSVGSSVFGACLRAVSGTGVAGTWTVNATCPATNGTYWNAIPATGSAPEAKIAQSTVAGTANATANIRFGMRPASNQPTGAYFAPVVFEVAAPNA